MGIALETDTEMMLIWIRPGLIHECISKCISSSGGDKIGQPLEETVGSKYRYRLARR